ncbi:hypothetical protein ACTFIY_001404 [Dictyostelium cf. discoideum]
MLRIFQMNHFPNSITNFFQLGFEVLIIVAEIFGVVLTKGIIPASIKDLHMGDIKHDLMTGSIPNTLNNDTVVYDGNHASAQYLPLKPNKNFGFRVWKMFGSNEISILYIDISFETNIFQTL